MEPSANIVSVADVVIVADPVIISDPAVPATAAAIVAVAVPVPEIAVPEIAVPVPVIPEIAVPVPVIPEIAVPVPVIAVIAVPAVATAIIAVPVAAMIAVPTVPIVSVSTLDKNLAAVFKVITTDNTFLTRVKAAVDNIMRDGKVDQTDIPEIVFVISETVNSLDSFHVTSDLVPVLIKMLYNFIIDTYKLVPEDKKAEFERVVDSSLRLLMLQPKVKQALGRCFAYLSCGAK